MTTTHWDLWTAQGFVTKFDLDPLGGFSGPESSSLVLGDWSVEANECVLRFKG